MGLFARVTQAKQKAKVRADFRTELGKAAAELEMANAIARSKDGGLLIHARIEKAGA